ncbi:NmrA family NAD(P)-binding protein [Nocardia sp. bgisy134]|uniref:NmrA family NAD(P)-binding protein n=1 Tax=Nocardia sp. bgisy134 TaxID=3413789 RepID=UPI003D738591
MSSQHDPILVTGGTGKQGGVTARRLRADGIPVRVLVRDPDAPAARALAAAGAELAIGDFDAPDTLLAAATGARGVFAVPPATYRVAGWDGDLEARRGIALIEAARTAGVDHVVFTGVGSLGDDIAWGAHGKQRIEEALVASGLRYTVLRPVRFMENYLLQGSPVDGIAHGVHRHLFPADRPLQMIAVDDIAVFAALAFADPDRFHGQILELAGDAVTPVAAAAAIARATGHPVRYEEVSEAEAEAIGPEIVNVWRVTRETGGWHADLPALRELHPGLWTLDTWLASGGADRIGALLDAQKASAAR